jgi:hypothetical protein
MLAIAGAVPLYVMQVINLRPKRLQKPDDSSPIAKLANALTKLKNTISHFLFTLSARIPYIACG